MPLQTPSEETSGQRSEVVTHAYKCHESLKAVARKDRGVHQSNLHRLFTPYEVAFDVVHAADHSSAYVGQTQRSTINTYKTTTKYTFTGIEPADFTPLNNSEDRLKS